MNWVRKLVLIGFILKSATGCTAVDALAIAFLVEDFAKGVMLLSKVIKGDFALAENVNSRAFRNNLKFQLETGGNIDVTQQPMYSTADLAARAAVLNNLTQYAQSLAIAASGDHAASSLAPRINYAEPVNLERLDVLHSVDLSGIAELQHGLEFFKSFFELPEREARLAAIVASGGSGVEKAAKLLYLDLGAKSDQVKACSYAAPKANSLRKIHNLILCRGGLRGRLKSVIEKELVVWKKRLSFTRRPKAAFPDKHLMGKLISIQKSGRQVDQMILQTQVAIKKMVSSHDQIVQMLKHSDRDNTASDFFALQAFLEEVTVLTERAKWITPLIDEETNQSTATIAASNSAITKHTD